MLSMAAAQRAAAALALLIAVAAAADCYGDSEEFEGFDDVHEMTSGRSDLTATVYNDRIYLVGGCAADQECSSPTDHFSCVCSTLTNKAEYYVPETDEYVALNDAPRDRYRHAAADANGWLFLFGGRDVNDAVIPEVDALNLATGEWVTACSWPATAAGPVSDQTAFSEDDRIFVVGGYNETYTTFGRTWEFTFTWTNDEPTDCTVTMREPMSTVRGDIQSTNIMLGDAVGHFVVGGFENGEVCASTTTVESYDVASDTWTSHTPLLEGRADMALGVIENWFFAIAGETVDSECHKSIPVDDVERFEAGEAPYSGEFFCEDPVPSDRFRFAGASYGDRIYLFGGQGAFTESLGGSAGTYGYPIHQTAMLYTPRTVRDDDDLSDGEIAGIVLGVIVAACICGAIIGVYCLYRQRMRYYQEQEDVDEDKAFKSDSNKHEVEIAFNDKI
mmetsp:Transcript_8039/g.22951  ORF Transcript_8039/g.22951 Transcript_8039/m.22951 type:complete len:446 (-) Transcript_8039:2592-3929(-)